MPAPSVILSVAAFVVVACVVVFAVLRMVSAGGRVRRGEAAAGAACEVARRAQSELGELIEAVDAIRYRQVGPDVVGEPLAQAAEVVSSCRDEVQALVQKQAQTGPVQALVADLERAERAIDTIEHGCHLLELDSFESRTEGETSIKRGYLNLVHARVAIGQRCVEIDALASGRKATGVPKG